jgi:hypothetical protein
MSHMARKTPRQWRQTIIRQQYVASRHLGDTTLMTFCQRQ